MSTEHVFEVRLFIGAAAITALSVAITQAGWKHKAFVNGLFVLTVILAALSIFWPLVAPYLSEDLDSDLGRIASSTTAWLVLMFLTVTAICLLDFAARSKWQREFPKIAGLLERKEIISAREPQHVEIDSRQWMASYNILDLGNPDLIRRVLETQREAKDTEREIAENDAQQRAARAKLATGGGQYAELKASLDPAPPELEALREVASNLYQRKHTAEQSYYTAHGNLLREIYEKLATGKLIAKGFLHPIGRHPSYRDIPAPQWRIIRFNADMTEAQGQSLKYSGIAVARAS
jgi:hypothetical protein